MGRKLEILCFMVTDEKICLGELLEVIRFVLLIS